MNYYYFQENIMQHYRVNTNNTVMMSVKIFFWVAGLLIAGSEGNLMPWANGVGLLMFVTSSFFLVRHFSCKDLNAEARMCSGVSEKNRQKRVQIHRSFIIPAEGL